MVKLKNELRCSSAVAFLKWHITEAGVLSVFYEIETLTNTNTNIMTTERIKEIQAETGYPDSVSVQQALLKVWNECEQENVKNCNTPAVSNRRELLIAFACKLNNVSIDQYRTYYGRKVDDFLKSN